MNEAKNVTPKWRWFTPETNRTHQRRRIKPRPDETPREEKDHGVSRIHKIPRSSIGSIPSNKRQRKEWAMNLKQAKESQKALMEAVSARQEEIYQKLIRDPQNADLIKKLEWIQEFQLELYEDQIYEDLVNGFWAYKNAIVISASKFQRHSKQGIENDLFK
jgi:hypothetical protein